MLRLLWVSLAITPRFELVSGYSVNSGCRELHKVSGVVQVLRGFQRL